MSTTALSSRLAALRCFSCEREHDPRALLGVCAGCGLPLRVDYELRGARMSLAELAERPPSLWRYREVLPLVPGAEVSLGEGFTPLLPVGPGTWVKDEAQNPTGSFKARGMAVAVSMARALGARALCAPSAGNAAGALAAYGARAGLPVTVAVPEDTPRPFLEECAHYGATVHLVKGTISDAGKFLREHGPGDAFDVSTLREPYRIEGKKTMAFELFEQLGGELPDVLVYPTGGGTGLVGMWKAFFEMEALGWLAPQERWPRLISVQISGCQPVVSAFERGEERTQPWPDPHTRAYGLRVPAPLGGFLCLRALRETHGDALAVSDEAALAAARALAAHSGIDVCPEGGAAWAACEQLRAAGRIAPHERVVVFNTGTGLKYR